MDNLYIYRVSYQPNIPYTKALMYEFINVFMFGAMSVEMCNNEDQGVVFFLKPDYQMIQKTINKNSLKLHPAEILQNHIDLFEIMLNYHHALPIEMLTNKLTAQATMELFSEYLLNKIHSNDMDISVGDFKHNFLHQK